MGEWDEYCTVCGGPPFVPSDDVNDEEGQPRNPPSTQSCRLHLAGVFRRHFQQGRTHPGPLASYNGLGSFDIPPDSSPYSYFVVCLRDADYIHETAAKGCACHVACYNLLQQELNYTLKCADVLPLLVDKEYDCNKFSWSDYGGRAEYQDQDFLDAYLVKDGKLWMIEDPSRDAQNKERILQLWRPLLESGFKRPDAAVGDGSLAPEIAKMNLDESKA